MRKELIGLVLLLCINQTSNCQINIISKSFSSYSISPGVMISIGINNAGSDKAIVLESNLSNATGEVLINVATRPFILKHGISSTGNIALKESEIIFGKNKQAEYIRTHHILPSGSYTICYKIITSGGDEELFNDCEDIVSEYNSNLFLVSPFNEEIIEEKYPLLIWQHSESFELLNSGEYFRMLVVEINEDQQPEAAVSLNAPVMLKDFILSHQVRYPFDAIQLLEGKRYAWEVEKISKGAIIQKSETWMFQYKLKKEEEEKRFVSLTNSVDGGFYIAKGNKVYFRLDEDYTGEELNWSVIDGSGNNINTGKSANIKGQSTLLKVHGYNQFELDFSKCNLKTGYYLLEVMNKKGLNYKQKIFIE